MYKLLKGIYTRCFFKKMGGQLSPHATTLDPPLIEGVIIFRIDSRTIKRRILWLSGYRVPLGVIVLVLAFRT